MEHGHADKNMCQEAVGNLCNDMEEENRALTKAIDSQNRKLVNIQSYFEETKRQMADALKKNTTERDNVKNELKKLQEDNRRYRDELEECERRSRAKGQMEPVASDSDVEEVERIVQTTTKELEGLESKEKEDLKTNIAAIATATKMVDKINEEYKSKLQSQRKELNMAEETKTSNEAKFEGIQEKITMMQGDVKRKKAELKKKEVEISGLEDSIQGTDKQVQVVQAKRDEHKRKLIQVVKDFKVARLEYKMVMHDKQKSVVFGGFCPPSSELQTPEIDHVKKQITDFQADTTSQTPPEKKKPGLFKRRFGWLYRRHRG